MHRLLIVPAAGLGSRLKAGAPKALVPVNGRPMLDHLRVLYARYVERTVVIANPSFSGEIAAWAERHGSIDVVDQPSPTGMLDAILLAAPLVERARPDRIWITWCDQVGVLPATLDRLAAEEQSDSLGLIVPTVRRAQPYIHFVRNANGRIVDVLHRREGDVMPEEGESDIGLFALSRATFEDALVRYAASVAPAAGTGERNFLPFVAWFSARARVATFPCTDPMEAIGINTPEELQLVERWLAARSEERP